MYLTIQNPKSSLHAGLNAFFDARKDGRIEYSKQAFSKGRRRIKPEAFQELFQSVVEGFYEKAKLTDWKDYQLFGIDGTRLNLPCTNELAELYGTQTSQGAPQVQALVSCVYDVLNGMIVDTRFAHCKSSERAAAKDNKAFQVMLDYNASMSYISTDSRIFINTGRKPSREFRIEPLSAAVYPI